jgi:hypothetical protein
MQGSHQLISYMGACTSLLGEPVLIFMTRIRKKGATIFLVYICEFTMPKKKLGLIILVALTMHHTPNLMSCNSRLHISLGLSANQYVILST